MQISTGNKICSISLVIKEIYKKKEKYTQWDTTAHLQECLQAPRLTERGDENMEKPNYAMVPLPWKNLAVS